MNSKISVFQFYSILFLTRLLTTLTYIPSYTKEINVSDMIFQTLFRFVFGIIIMLPVFYLQEKYGKETSAQNGIYEKTKAVIFSFVFFYFSVATVARLDLFAGTVVFPETDVKFFLLFVVAFCAYGAFLGLMPIARSAVLSVLPVVLSLVFIVFALVKKIDFLNLSPLFYNGIEPLLKTSLNAVGRTVEYAVIAVFLPFVKGNAKKGFFIWMTVQTFVTAGIFFLEATVLGNFSQMQLFPVFTLASMAEFSFFQGLETIITGVWVLCAFLKISFLLYLQAKLITDAFKVKKTHVFAVLGLLLSAICLFVSGSVERFNLVDTSAIKLILVLVSVPLLSVFEIIKRGVKKCVKQ